ncbi:hypothetical protein ACFWZ2_42015 [Streptomyces sp. NPDC059002]|uniref:hypothetical protein n=1 Tax=Streptomyces sp. NPDC059002 TaxID=3346690 RepID=UPI0036C47D66
MSSGKVRKMFRLMATGETVELSTPMSSLKKTARLAFIAEQFGYQYLDARYVGSGQSSRLVLYIAPDPSPQAQQRAARNRALYPHAAEAGPLPPFQPDAVELIKARAKFDYTGKAAEQRMLYGVGAVTVGAVVLAVKGGGDASAFLVAGVGWAALMALGAAGFVFNRRRNARFAARLHERGFVPVTDETGRVRYMPPWTPPPAQPGPYAPQQPYWLQPSGPAGPLQPPQPPQ